TCALPISEAPGIPDAEVWVEIPLALELLADIEAEHEVAAAIPLNLDVQPETEAPIVPDAGVWAEIPLGLGLGAGAVADHTVTAGIPLTLGVSPRADADEDVFNLKLVALAPVLGPQMVDRKSTRLNSSH